MAKTLDERITSARSTDRITITDLKALIPEIRAEEERQRAKQAAAEIESCDLALSEADRDEAAATASRAGRLAKAYAEAAADLDIKLLAKKESEKRQAVEAERKAALAERDEIAAEFATFMPAAIAEMTKRFEAIQRNKERMKKVGLREQNAEGVARRIKGHYIGYTPVAWYHEMKIPAWDGKGRAWPVERHVDYDAAARAAKRIVKAQAAEREAQWGVYRVHPIAGQGTSFKVRLDPKMHVEKVASIYREPWVGQMKHAEVERLRKFGVKVESIDPSEMAEAAE